MSPKQNTNHETLNSCCNVVLYVQAWISISNDRREDVGMRWLEGGICLERLSSAKHMQDTDDTGHYRTVEGKENL